MVTSIRSKPRAKTNRTTVLKTIAMPLTFHDDINHRIAVVLDLMVFIHTEILRVNEVK